MWLFVAFAMGRYVPRGGRSSLGDMNPELFLPKPMVLVMPALTLAPTASQIDDPGKLSRPLETRRSKSLSTPSPSGIQCLRSYLASPSVLGLFPKRPEVPWNIRGGCNSRSHLEMARTSTLHC